MEWFKNLFTRKALLYYQGDSEILAECVNQAIINYRGCLPSVGDTLDLPEYMYADWVPRVKVISVCRTFMETEVRPNNSSIHTENNMPILFVKGTEE